MFSVPVNGKGFDWNEEKPSLFSALNAVILFYYSAAFASFSEYIKENFFLLPCVKKNVYLLSSVTEGKNHTLILEYSLGDNVVVSRY